MVRLCHCPLCYFFVIRLLCFLSFTCQLTQCHFFLSIDDADAVLERIVNFFDEFDSEMDNDFKEDMLDFMLDKVLLGAGEKRAKVIKSLIPASPRRLKRVQEAGGTFMYRYSDMIRTPSWLEKHGLCGMFDLFLRLLFFLDYLRSNLLMALRLFLSFAS